MCYPFYAQPYIVPLKQHRKSNGNLVLDYSLLLGKVTEKRNGYHKSDRGFTYLLGNTVYDGNAVVGDHEESLHFAPSPDSVNQLLGSYGSHRLAVLPAPEVWDPVKKRQKAPRCWHSSAASTLFCLECDGTELEVIDNPDFWKDLNQIRSFSGRSSLQKLLANDLVWHRQVELSLN